MKKSANRMRIGSLFSGYGGLDLAIEAVFDAETVWHCEWEDAPSTVLEAHWPGVPNYRDVTQVDFNTVEPVDILCGGFPCQDVSLAGARRGLGEGTRSGLWSEFRRAIEQLQPKFVVIENVRGLLSAKADSDLEHCAWCLGDEPGEPALRALGAVLGDLADLGYSAAWHGVRASDAGAPHQRFRVFILAWPELADSDGSGPVHGLAGFDSARGGEYALGKSGASLEPSGSLRAIGTEPKLVTLPTPTTSEATGAGAHGTGGDNLRTVVSLLPTPAAVDGSGSGRHNSPGHQETLPGTVRELLPTPNTMEHLPVRTGEARERQLRRGDLNGSRRASMGNLREDVIELETNWGQFEPAIRRWEAITRPAPAPTEPTGKDGSERLSPKFTEWMMGLPDGWVTGHGLSRNDELKMCGNGVVPQQAELALRELIGAVNERLEV